MSTTSVVPRRARASQSRGSVPAGSWWPVTTVNPLERPRIVTGIPAAAGPAMAELTPGTTSTSPPAALRVTASSPPRPTP